MFRTDKIAILMATYNGEKYIEEQLDSILKQSNQNWVLYIHDDGSSDQTPQIILEYQNKYDIFLFFHHLYILYHPRLLRLFQQLLHYR